MTELERMMCLILSLGDALTKKEDILSLPSDKQLEFAAQHLLANSVLLLPCKVGDTVYAYSEDFFTILPYFVENVNVGYIDESRNYIVYEANCHADETDELLDEIDFDFDDFGPHPRGSGSRA